MNIYPQQLQQIGAYCEALTEADKKLISSHFDAEMMVDLHITVNDIDGGKLGVIRDFIGAGAWSFEAAS